MFGIGVELGEIGWLATPQAASVHAMKKIISLVFMTQTLIFVNLSSV